MKIEGSFNVGAPRAQVWEKITDHALMASCIPGCDEIEQLSPTSYAAKVTVAIGPIKAKFNLVVEVVSQEAPERVVSRTRGEEGSRASMVSADNTVALTEIDATTTEVAYSSEISVTGRLGKFGLGMMKKKATALGEDFVTAFRTQVETAVAPA